MLKPITKYPELKNKVKYYGEVDYYELPKHYKQADIFVFASLCETFGIILLEAMASGLPIACSNRSSMPDLLGNAGVYFDPNEAKSIKDALTTLIQDKKMSDALAFKASERTKSFSWDRCANETFAYLTELHQKRNQIK